MSSHMGEFQDPLLLCVATLDQNEFTASPTPKVLSAQPIGAPVFKVRGWANSQLTKYHSFHVKEMFTDLARSIKNSCMLIFSAYKLLSARYLISIPDLQSKVTVGKLRNSAITKLAKLSCTRIAMPQVLEILMS